MTRPRLLDLFCGAGGCSVGYHRAGCDVTGVDIEQHDDYPYELIVADAMDVLTDRSFLDRFDIAHASPPCPRYSSSTRASKTWQNHPDLVAPVREALREWGGTWVIENVPGAPMPNAVMVCGQAMGLRRVKRHRLFESNVPLMTPGCACDAQGKVSVFGHAGQLWVNKVRSHIPIAEVRQLLDVPWMTRREDIADAIPPAYTEFIGSQLIDQLALTRASSQ